MIFTILLTIVILIVVTWIAGFIFSSSFLLPSKNLKKYKNIRAAEAVAASKIQKISKLIHKKNQLKEYIKNALEEIQPDLVITYDLAGLYGHPDHRVPFPFIPL